MFLYSPPKEYLGNQTSVIDLDRFAVYIPNTRLPELHSLCASQATENKSIIL